MKMTNRLSIEREEIYTLKPKVKTLSFKFSILLFNSIHVVVYV